MQKQNERVGKKLIICQNIESAKKATASNIYDSNSKLALSKVPKLNIFCVETKSFFKDAQPKEDPKTKDSGYSKKAVYIVKNDDKIEIYAPSSTNTWGWTHFNATGDIEILKNGLSYKNYPTPVTSIGSWPNYFPMEDLYQYITLGFLDTPGVEDKNIIIPNSDPKSHKIEIPDDCTEVVFYEPYGLDQLNLINLSHEDAKQSLENYITALEKALMATGNYKHITKITICDKDDKVVCTVNNPFGQKEIASEYHKGLAHLMKFTPEQRLKDLYWALDTEQKNIRTRLYSYERISEFFDFCYRGLVSVFANFWLLCGYSEGELTSLSNKEHAWLTDQKAAVDNLMSVINDELHIVDENKIAPNEETSLLGKGGKKERTTEKTAYETFLDMKDNNEVYSKKKASTFRNILDDHGGAKQVIKDIDAIRTQATETQDKQASKDNSKLKWFGY